MINSEKKKQDTIATMKQQERPTHLKRIHSTKERGSNWHRAESFKFRKQNSRGCTEMLLAGSIHGQVSAVLHAELCITEYCGVFTMELDDRILAPACTDKQILTTNLDQLLTFRSCRRTRSMATGRLLLSGRCTQKPGGIKMYAMVVCSLRDLNFAAADGRVVVDSRHHLKKQKKPEKHNIPWLRIAHVVCVCKASERMRHGPMCAMSHTNSPIRFALSSLLGCFT